MACAINRPINWNFLDLQVKNGQPAGCPFWVCYRNYLMELSSSTYFSAIASPVPDAYMPVSVS